MPSGGRRRRVLAGGRVVGVGRRPRGVDGVGVGARLRREVQGGARPVWLLRRLHGWGWGVRPPFRLLSRSQGRPHRRLRPQRRLRAPHLPRPGLLGLRRPPRPHRLQHRRRRPLCLRPRHRARRPHEARHGRDVHLLLLLWRHRHPLRHCLPLPLVARPLRRHLPPLHLLSRRRHPLRLRVPEVVPGAQEDHGGHGHHATDSAEQQKELAGRGVAHSRRRRRGERRGSHLRLSRGRCSFSGDQDEAGTDGAHQLPLLRGLLWPQPERRQPPDQPLPDRPPQRRRRDAGVRAHRGAAGLAGQEAAGGVHHVAQRGVLRRGELAGRRGGVQDHEDGLWGSGHLRHGGHLQPAVHLHDGVVPDGGEERSAGVRDAGRADGGDPGAAGGGAGREGALRGVRGMRSGRGRAGVLPAGDDEQAPVRHHGRHGGRRERPGQSVIFNPLIFSPFCWFFSLSFLGMKSFENSVKIHLIFKDMFK